MEVTRHLFNNRPFLTLPNMDTIIQGGNIIVKFNLKKKVAKALIFAMVMGMVGVHGISLKSPVKVMPERTEYTEPVINYKDYTATITPAGSSSAKDKYVFLEVLKDESASKIINTYSYEVGSQKQ